MNVLNGPLIYSSCLVLAHNLYLHWKFIVLYYLQMASEALKKRGHVYRCAECPYAGDRRQFETHYVTKHADGDDVPFLCKECGLRFVGMRAYRYHVKAQHPEVDVEANCGGSQLKVNLDKADHAILSRKDSMAHYESNGRGASPRAPAECRKVKVTGAARPEAAKSTEQSVGSTLTAKKDSIAARPEAVKPSKQAVGSTLTEKKKDAIASRPEAVKPSKQAVGSTLTEKKKKDAIASRPEAVKPSTTLMPKGNDVVVPIPVAVGSKRKVTGALTLEEKEVVARPAAKKARKESASPPLMPRGREITTPKPAASIIPTPVVANQPPRDKVMTGEDAGPEKVPKGTEPAPLESGPVAATPRTVRARVTREIFGSDSEGVVSEAESDVESIPDSGSCYQPSGSAGSRSSSSSSSSSSSGSSLSSDGESDGEERTIEDFIEMPAESIMNEQLNYQEREMEREPQPDPEREPELPDQPRPHRYDESGLFGQVRDMCETIITRSIHDTVEAVTSAIIAGVKMNAPTISFDQGPLIGSLMATNANLGLLATNIKGQTESYVNQEKPLTRAIESLTASVEGFRKETTRLSETVEKHSNLISSVGPKFMGEFAVLRGLFNTVRESNEALSANLAAQSASFKAVTGKLNGIIEDDKRNGGVPSLVRKILNLSPVKSTSVAPAKSGHIAPTRPSSHTENVQSRPASEVPPRMVHRSPVRATETVTMGPVSAVTPVSTAGSHPKPRSGLKHMLPRPRSTIAVPQKGASGRGRGVRPAAFMSPIRPGFTEMMNTIRKRIPHKGGREKSKENTGPSAKE